MWPIQYNTTENRVNQYYLYYYYHFTKENYEICLVLHLLWPVVINKTIIQQNRIKTLHHNGNPL